MKLAYKKPATEKEKRKMNVAFAFRTRNLALALKMVGGGNVEVRAKTDGHGVYSSNARIIGSDGSWIASLSGLLDPVSFRFDCTALLEVIDRSGVPEMGVAEIVKNKIHFFVGKKEIVLDFEKIPVVK